MKRISVAATPSPLSKKSAELADYYKVRLEQTIQHTQRSSNLFYLVDGALLAMLYFSVEKLGGFALRHELQIALLVFLSLVNVMHCWFVYRQSKWYHEIDGIYRAKVGAAEFKRPWGPSSHWLFNVIHLMIALAALFAAGVLLRLKPEVLLTQCI